MTARSSAADRRRPTPWDFVVALIVAAAAVALLFLLKQESGNFLTATVVLDGETIAQYDLTALTGPVTLEVEDASYPLTIQAEPAASAFWRAAVPAWTVSTPAGLTGGPADHLSAQPAGHLPGRGIIRRY